MKMSFRWYGHNDPVTLEKIGQIPGVEGIVSAIYEVPVGEVWPADKIQALKRTIEQHGLELTAIESVPVHEDIKMGAPGRDRYIDNYIKTLQNLGRVGIDVVCYNFMPVFDWMRSRLDYKLPDGSRALIYEQEKVKEMDPAKGELDLPGWDTSYEQEELQDLLSTYRDISDADLWDNLDHFLSRIVEPAEEAGVKMAIHPDDPPWSIFGLPRIITDRAGIKRLTELVDSPANGLAICSGSLGADPENDLPAIIREFGRENLIHFAHVRNIKITGDKCFQESAHRSEAGSLDIYEIMKAYHDIGFKGPLRPDHGRMIWGEEGKPGYGLYDRALGATYLSGIWEALKKNN